ncbi:MAG: hypothetical protein ACM34N_10830 [Ignavibacteria bacterium]
MKVNFTKNFLISFFILFSGSLTAQNLDSKTLREHQAVKDYIAREESKRNSYNSSPDAPAYAKKDEGGSLAKTSRTKNYKTVLMNGNKIKILLTDYGGIGGGYDFANNREFGNVIWKGVPYVFQFIPVVGAAVPDASNPNKKLHIISDALDDYELHGLIEINPTKDTLWQFNPLPGYADPDQESMAINPDNDLDGDGKPDSWPHEWYNPTLGQYVWPGYLKQGENNADYEVFWGMDDRENREFNYFPFNNDPSRRGLGIKIEGRAFQWTNSLAENAVFFVYTITNISDKDLDSVFFGIYGDPDLGGSADNADDIGFFIPPFSIPGHNVDDIPLYSRSMVYLRDEKSNSSSFGPTYFLGCKFLESPGNPNDGIDNDDDGLTDESQFNLLDDDGDWNRETDDVGLDGISNTADFGESDGAPTAGDLLQDGSLNPLRPGEPNFEYTDLDEADQIGLTSFSDWVWKSFPGGVANDEEVWTRNKPGQFAEFETEGADITFTFGSGYISLKKGESKRISMALLLGVDYDDLLTTAATIQDIYNKNYNFFKPPTLPTLTAVPDDKKVTLYWDTNAEESIDPLFGKDFEGYVIYRSTDPSFSDIQNISDAKGAPFLYEPLKMADGRECKWDRIKTAEPFVDVPDSTGYFNGTYDLGETFTDVNGDGIWSSKEPDMGYSPIAYPGRGVHYYLGNNSGLVHSFIDSNNVINGKTYYYAVVAYDHGDISGIPPSETTKKILVDAITNEITLDKNTAAVIPGPRASGYQQPVYNNSMVNHPSGISNGEIDFIILNDLLVDDNEYILSFDDSLTIDGIKTRAKNYSIIDPKVYTKSLSFFGTNFTDIGYSNIIDDQYLKLKDENGTEYSRVDANDTSNYIINLIDGKIRRSASSSIPDDPSKIYTLEFKYKPISQSTFLNNEDNNDVFNGIKVQLSDYPRIEFNPDPEYSKWIKGTSTMSFFVAPSSLGSASIKETYPADYVVEFYSDYVDSANRVSTGQPITKIPVKYKVQEVTPGKIPQNVYTVLNENVSSSGVIINNQWDIGEEVVFYKTGQTGEQGSKLTWGLKLSYPAEGDTIYPGDGDALFISIKRPFTEEDTFYVKTVKGKIDNLAASSSLDNIYVVPNPYVGYNELEPANVLPGQGRGERRVYFENLPSRCTIRIYTLSGDPVRTLEHDAGPDNAREFWNLLNKDGFSVSYGLYIAHIDAPGIGEKMIKFALIK